MASWLAAFPLLTPQSLTLASLCVAPVVAPCLTHPPSACLLASSHSNDNS